MPGMNIKITSKTERQKKVAASQKTPTRHLHMENRESLLYQKKKNLLSCHCRFGM